jgi:heparan-alpha-glucosaminide N-acetyltransferase
MDEGAKRMEEGINLALDDNAKDDLLKKQERTNINGDSNIKQQIVEEDDVQPALVKQKPKRVATLDAFRGLTIVVIN